MSKTITKKINKKTKKSTKINPKKFSKKPIIKSIDKPTNLTDIDFDKLIHIVETSTKHHFIAIEFNKKPVNNIANLGAKVNQKARLERSGEYYGIGVEILESIRPLLTNRLISKILKLLKQENLTSPLKILDLNSLDELHYVLHYWLKNATTVYDDCLNSYDKPYPEYDQWIRTVRSDPLNCKIRLTEIGFNEKTGGSVVPADWIDKEFDSGISLHKEMDKLETRIGKPPATYAIIHSMMIQKQDSIIEDITNTEFDYLFYVDLIDNKLVSKLVSKISKKPYQYIKYDNTVIGFCLEDILTTKSQNNKKPREVGLYVSRLQKSIRRGRFGSQIMRETIDAINESPNYNLPEHGFMRVSASKQLVWRLFISILEDCRPYVTCGNELSLLDLILLVLITQKCLEYKFTDNLLELIKITALLAQYNDTKSDLFNWRKFTESTKTPINSESDYHTAISLALSNVIMMSGDTRMLKKLYSANFVFKEFKRPKCNSVLGLTSNNFKLTDKDTYQDIMLTSIDHHCKPNIILYYQACIPVSLTTREISSYIWKISSSYNIRSGKPENNVDQVLRSVQNFLLEKPTKISNETGNTFLNYSCNGIEPDNKTRRTSFLILFGSKYKFGGKDVMLAGTKKNPVKIKTKNEWTYSKDIAVINAYPKKYIYTKYLDPPFGFKWTKPKFWTEVIDGKPYVDGTNIDFFDGSIALKSITPLVTRKCNKYTTSLITTFFSGLDIELENIIDVRNKSKPQIVNWANTIDLNDIDLELVRCTYTKIFNQFNNTIMIGPCDRSGNKMHNSINYKLEGKLWAIFNLLHYLYPKTINPNSTLNFSLNRSTQGYIHLIKSLEQLLFVGKNITGLVPTISTKLWDHQQETVNTIMAKFTDGYHGFGDASDVGSGKTLTSLSLASKLIDSNNDIHSGILVLLPGNKLIATWQDEIDKHTKNFDVKLHKPSGNIGKIKRNTIVISTMGRQRDNPINHKWLLVIIDECLSVQNKNALQTEQAFIQSLLAKYLVMMSATFFRTRFDKLYYMLKMLQTGLPERKQYLETILAESIVAKVPLSGMKWTTNINKFQLNSLTRELYSKIVDKDLSVEAKYAKLNSLLVSNKEVNNVVVKQLSKLILELSKQGCRCLIYARSQDEAKLWSENLKIPIYPKKGDHCIVTYHDGTYGLNDLVIYNTIVMRPPTPDSLPQIKGRLARPGQKNNNLRIEYFVFENTIEEGLLIRLEIASKFVHQYIMPLAKFYNISVNHQKYK